MDLKELKKELPFKWRVQSVNEYGAQCVAYIDARDVQDLLDEVVGQENWEAKYSEQKGNLFCTIYIYCEYKDGFKWVGKSDCGTESNVEKQKGEASDAFKRAAVMWGVGRFLYSKTIIKLDSMKDKRGKFQPAFNGKILYGARVTDACNHLDK
jgi:hypothetical protein